MRKSIGSFFLCLKSLKGGGAGDLTCRSESPYRGQYYGYGLYGMVYSGVSAGGDAGYFRDTAVRPAGDG